MFLQGNSTFHLNPLIALEGLTRPKTILACSGCSVSHVIFIKFNKMKYNEISILISYLVSNNNSSLCCFTFNL